MRSLLSLLIVFTLTFFACQSEMGKKGKLVEEVNIKVSKIDHSHRQQIIESDFRRGDSLYKVRGYYMDNELQKVVGIIQTPHFERDDYFYFENGAPIFTGHFMNFRDDNLAEEFKYYFKNGNIANTLMWEDHYTPGKRFPHETFEHFDPDLDSLMNAENNRLAFFMRHLEQDAIEIKAENENLGANQ